MFALITMNAAGGRRPPRPCLAVCSRRAQPSGGQGGSSSAELRLPLRFIFTFVPPTAQHGTAHWAATTGPPGQRLVAAWVMRAISSNQTASIHILAQSSSSLVTVTLVTPPSTAALPRTLGQDTLCGPNLPSQQLQVTKHPRLVSCSSLRFLDTKMQRQNSSRLKTNEAQTSVNR